jgi:hypothetical protein
MRTKSILWLLTAALLVVTCACDRTVNVPVPDVPDPEGETVLEEDVYQSVDVEEVGSISLNVVNSFTDGVSIVNCDTMHTIWLQFYENYPNLVSKHSQGFEEVECEVVMVRTGTIGSATTTGTLPVTYTFNAQFAPYPKCEFTLQVDMLAAFSQVKELHDSQLGDLALPDGLGDDLMTEYPSHVFRMQGETHTIIEGLVTWKITPDDYIIPSWTRCAYP